MHSRKSAGPRLEHWRTPPLTGYTCENFLFRITRSRLLLRKDEIRPNIWPEVPQDFSLWRRLAWQTLSKSFNIATATARVAPDLLNTLATLSDTTVRRSTIDREDLEPYWKSEKMLHFSRWSISLLFKYFTNNRKKTNRAVVFSCRPFSYILKYRNHRWNLPTIWKTRFLQSHIEEFL